LRTNNSLVIRQIPLVVSSMSTLKTEMLTEEQVIAAPESDYMNQEQLDFFREKLIELHKSTCIRIQEAKDQMMSPMDISDPNDRATIEEQANIALRIVEREQKLLPKIQQSLERIRYGDYGYCLETGGKNLERDERTPL